MMSSNETQEELQDAKLKQAVNKYQSFKTLYKNLNDRTEYELAEQTVVQLKNSNVKLVAIDFEQTLISINTHGLWVYKDDLFLELYRPCFAYLIASILINTDDTYIAILSIESIDVIKGFLSVVFGNKFNR